MYQRNNSTNNALHVKYALKIIIDQMRIYKQRTTNISPFEAHFGRKLNTPRNVISSKLKLSNLSYEYFVNHYLYEDTVMPEELLLDEKWITGYRSDIGVEARMTRASQEAHNRERESTDGESRFLRTIARKPFPLKERAVELKLAMKIHGKRRTKKNFEGLYEVLAPGSHILKVPLHPLHPLLKSLANSLSQCETAISENLELYRRDRLHRKRMRTVEGQE